MSALLLESVRLPGGAAPIDVLLRDGLIAACGPSLREREPAVERIGGGGRLLAPAFVEAHLHIEKALLMDRLPGEVGSVGEAIAATAALKRGFTRDDMRERAEAVLRMARRHGTLFARAHVEVDPILGLSALEMALELRERLAGVMTLQVAAFPQEGIQKSPGTEQLLHEALRLGADVLGGVPYVDPDPVAHLNTVFRMAMAAGVPLDLHADFSDDPPGERPGLTARHVARRALTEGYLGRVALGHVTALGALPPDELAPLADLLARAQVSVVTLPATDLYLGGRADTHNVRRALAPVRALRAAGVNVAYASNNVRNAFTPFGNADPLEVGLLLMAGGHLASHGDVDAVFEMATVNAARVLGLTGYGVSVGDRANLVLLDATSPWDALVSQAEKTLVIANGRVIVESRRATIWHDEPA
ncbi:MAG: amidohydrolase family protein [Chloroflexota bacterium]